MIITNHYNFKSTNCNSEMNAKKLIINNSWKNILEIEFADDFRHQNY